MSDADLAALLVRLEANSATNSKLAEQYTSDELWHNRNFDKNGKTTVDESAKFENVFVEGLPYRKQVEANGKALSGKEAAAEERRYKRAVSERRAMSTKQKRLSLHRTWNFALPMCCLAKLFVNSIVGYEQVDGVDTVVVESVPRADARPSNNDEKSALDWKQKSWISVRDAMFARVEAESVRERKNMLKGMTIRIDFERLNDGPAGEATEHFVWLTRSVTSKFNFKILWISATGMTEQRWSNYKKFHVDMRLLEDTVTPVSGESQ